VFTLETRCTIIIDDELQWLVEPAVLAVTMPVLVCTLFECDWSSIVEADDERGCFDSFD
jgi:hypothetical protein